VRDTGATAHGVGAHHPEISTVRLGPSTAQPPDMLTKSDELKDRINVKKHELLAKYNELKADTNANASSARDKVKAKLDDLEDALKDGWDNVTDAVKARLNKWLDNN
jgi:hypothetical protein